MIRGIYTTRASSVVLAIGKRVSSSSSSSSKSEIRRSLESSWRSLLSSRYSWNAPRRNWSTISPKRVSAARKQRFGANAKPTFRVHAHSARGTMACARATIIGIVMKIPPSERERERNEESGPVSWPQIPKNLPQKTSGSERLENNAWDPASMYACVLTCVRACDAIVSNASPQHAVSCLHVTHERAGTHRRYSPHSTYTRDPNQPAGQPASQSANQPTNQPTRQPSDRPTDHSTFHSTVLSPPAHNEVSPAF